MDVIGTYFAVAAIRGGPAIACGCGRMGVATTAERWHAGYVWGSGASQDLANLKAVIVAQQQRNVLGKGYRPI